MAELFTNLGSTTVSSGGTDAPAAGTSQTWTVASSASFPAVNSTAGNTFRVVENDVVRQSEIILVTNVSGTTWTVTRGAEGTTPIAHPAGWTAVQTVTRDVMQGWEDKLGLRAGLGITGGGQITFDASGNLSWNARFIFISQAKGANGSTAGYFDIDQPANGTVIAGAGGATNVTVTAAGIPIGAWSALWYILPVGSSNLSVAANFRVTIYNASGDFTPPDDWVLIAVRSGDSGAVRLCNGLTLMPGSVVPVGSATNTPVLVPFHLGGTVPVAISKPKFMATRVIRFTSARWYLESGTVTPAIYVNGTNTVQGGSMSAGGGSWTFDFSVNPGDRVQLGATASSAGTEFSATLEGFAR